MLVTDLQKPLREKAVKYFPSVTAPVNVDLFGGVFSNNRPPVEIATLNDSREY